jgi:tetratricopeptide (TPR) repeat protein
LQEQQYAAAAEQLQKALRLKPDQPLAHLLLGRAYQNSNLTLEAIEQFKAALRLKPDIELGHYHLGYAYASLGRDQEPIGRSKKITEEVLRRRASSATTYADASFLLHSLMSSGTPKFSSVVIPRPRGRQFGLGRFRQDIEKTGLKPGPDAKGVSNLAVVC